MTPEIKKCRMCGAEFRKTPRSRQIYCRDCSRKRASLRNQNNYALRTGKGAIHSFEPEFDATLEEIAGEIGVSRQRVQAIEKSAIENFRRRWIELCGEP